jgi:hypothetical protein
MSLLYTLEMTIYSIVSIEPSDVCLGGGVGSRIPAVKYDRLIHWEVSLSS